MASFRPLVLSLSRGCLEAQARDFSKVTSSPGQSSLLHLSLSGGFPQLSPECGPFLWPLLARTHGAEDLVSVSVDKSRMASIPWLFLRSFDLWPFLSPDWGWDLLHTPIACSCDFSSLPNDRSEAVSGSVPSPSTFQRRQLNQRLVSPRLQTQIRSSKPVPEGPSPSLRKFFSSCLFQILVSSLFYYPTSHKKRLGTDWLTGLERLLLGVEGTRDGGCG